MPTIDDIRKQNPDYDDVSTDDIVKQLAQNNNVSPEYMASYLGVPQKDLGQTLGDLGGIAVLLAAVTAVGLTVGMRIWARPSKSGVSLPVCIASALRVFRFRWAANVAWLIVWFVLWAVVFLPTANALSALVTELLGGSPNAAGFGGGAKGLIFFSSAMCLKYGWNIIKNAFASEPSTKKPSSLGVTSMNDNVKIALIVAATIVIAVSLYIYFSPYQSCIRETDNAFACARALGGH